MRKNSNFSTIVKFSIIVFILIAIYRSNGEKVKAFIQGIYSSVRQFETSITTDTASVPLKTEVNENTRNNNASITNNLSVATTSDSYIEVKLAQIFNKLMENPKFSTLIEKSLEQTFKSQATIIENDPAFERIIIQTNQEGTGPKVQCGDLVNVKYNMYSAQQYELNHDISKNPKQTATLYVGGNQIHQGVENSIIGMRKGAIRKSVFLNDLSRKTLSKLKETSKESFIIADIELVEIVKSKEKNNIKIYASRNSKPGSLNGLCGEIISSYYTIGDLNGKIIFDAKSQNKFVNIEVGGRHTPIEINTALTSTPIDKISFTIIGTPNDIIAAFAGKNLFFPENFSHPKNQIVILNVSAVK